MAPEFKSNCGSRFFPLPFPYLFFPLHAHSATNIINLHTSITSTSSDITGEGALVGAVNTNTRVITLDTVNTADLANQNVIFGEETSVNWVNIDIPRTKAINSSLAGQGGTPGTRLYLYGYTVEQSPPTTRVQGYTIGARQDGTGNTAVAV